MTTHSLIDIANTSGSQTQSLITPGVSGTLAQSAGTGSAVGFTTATYPSTAGTSGNVLTSDGTNWNSTAPAASGGLVFIAKQTASSSARLTFTSIPVYSNYFFTFESMSPSSATVNMLIRTSTNNGSSYDATGYKSGVNYSIYNTNVYVNANTTTGFLVAPVTTGDTHCANYYIMQTQSNNYIKGFGECQLYTGVDQAFGTGGGINTDYTAVNAFQIIMSSGNISTGTVCLYGIKES